MEKEFVIKIESISGLGKGIGKYRGIIVFVAGTCPDDIVKVKLIKQTKHYLIAELVEIIEPSPHRIKPICPMQKICGACDFQFIDYDYQLKIKKQIISDFARELKGIEIKDIIPSDKNIEYRHKVQYPVSQTKNSKKIIAGYYKQKSHEIVNIKYCPIQPEICNDIIDFIRNTAADFNISGYTEKTHSGLLRHVVMRASDYTKKVLITLVINDLKISNSLKQFAKNIYDNFTNISGICVNFNNKKTNLILSNKTELLYGKEFIEEKLIDKVFKISSNTFFQINPYTANNIFKYIKNYINDNYNNPSILDAYAGIATFGIIMSDVAKEVVSVEENADSVKMAENIVKENNIQNIQLFTDDTEKFLEKNNKKYDITILDPPRKGCTERVLDNVYKMTKSKIIYVSCNPQTLIRDLKYLISKGAKVSSIQPFDMFCHTYHTECVTLIDLA